jgi:hypothetical protein
MELPIIEAGSEIKHSKGYGYEDKARRTRKQKKGGLFSGPPIFSIWKND